MKRGVKLVPPIEKVRLRTLTATDGKAYAGVELEYHTTGGEATRIVFGLGAEDAAEIVAQLVQLPQQLCVRVLAQQPGGRAHAREHQSRPVAKKMSHPAQK